MKLRNSAADALNAANYTLARSAFSCLIVGLVVWPLFPVGIALGVSVVGVDRVVRKLRKEGGQQ